MENLISVINIVLIICLLYCCFELYSISKRLYYHDLTKFKVKIRVGSQENITTNKWYKVINYTWNRDMVKINDDSGKNVWVPIKKLPSHKGYQIFELS